MLERDVNNEETTHRDLLLDTENVSIKLNTDSLPMCKTKNEI